MGFEPTEPLQVLLFSILPGFSRYGDNEVTMKKESKRVPAGSNPTPPLMGDFGVVLGWFNDVIFHRVKREFIDW